MSAPIAMLAKLAVELAATEPAISLRLSARVFKGREPFSADLTSDMARDAVTMPAMYRHWAAEQAERALRLAVRL